MLQLKYHSEDEHSEDEHSGDEKRQVEPDELLFPNSVPLDVYFYKHKNYTDLRRAKLMLFGDCLHEVEKFATLSIFDKNMLLKDLERGCYGATRKKGNKKGISISWDSDDFTYLYHDICYKVASNINPNSTVGSKYLTDLILDGSVEPKNVASMTSQDMCPEQYTCIMEKIKLMNEGVKVKTSKLYYCSKCKRNETILSNCTDRGGDENTSLIIFCVFCGFRWRMAG
jgi:DNA-directed RNA polymerase subunit M/transcription elongation factor TFIIS